MIKLTPKECSLLFQLANEVWDEVAYDVLTGVAECTGKNVNSVIMKRADVIEIVLDADRLEEQVRRAKAESLLPLFPKEWDPKVNRQLHKLMKEAFPFKSYGM